MEDSPRTSTRTCQLSCDARRKNKRPTSRDLQSFCDKALVGCNQRLEPLQRCSEEVFHTEPRAERTCRIAKFQPGFSLLFAFCKSFIHPFLPLPEPLHAQTRACQLRSAPTPEPASRGEGIKIIWHGITLARNERRIPTRLFLKIKN